MKSILCVATVILLALLPSLLKAQTFNDRVQRRNSTESGTITATTPLGITISKGGVTNKIPAEDIRGVQFDGEPPELNAARSQFARGRFDTAFDRLQKIAESTTTRDEVRQEVDYYLAAAQANMALAGKADLKQSIAEVGQFQISHRTSFHIPEALELHGDLYLALKDFPNARKKYETLAKAPAPYYKALSALLVGKVLQEEGKHADAVAQFESAITTAGAGTVTADVRRKALLGKAVSLSATGKLSEAVNAIKVIFERLPEDDTAALAEGYIALGDCYRVSGDLKAARDAYLHVDLLFNASPVQHAEALFRLSEVWNELRQSSRAQDAQQRLTDNYSLSRWAGR